MAAIDAASWNPLDGFEVNMLAKTVDLPFRALPDPAAAEAAWHARRADFQRLNHEGASPAALWQAGAALSRAESVLTLARQQRDGIFDQIRFM